MGQNRRPRRGFRRLIGALAALALVGGSVIVGLQALRTSVKFPDGACVVKRGYRSDGESKQERDDKLASISPTLPGAQVAFSSEEGHLVPAVGFGAWSLGYFEPGQLVGSPVTRVGSESGRGNGPDDDPAAPRFLMLEGSMCVGLQLVPGRDLLISACRQQGNDFDDCYVSRHSASNAKLKAVYGPLGDVTGLGWAGPRIWAQVDDRVMLLGTDVSLRADATLEQVWSDDSHVYMLERDGQNATLKSVRVDGKLSEIGTAATKSSLALTSNQVAVGPTSKGFMIDSRAESVASGKLEFLSPDLKPQGEIAVDGAVMIIPQFGAELSSYLLIVRAVSKAPAVGDDGRPDPNGIVAVTARGTLRDLRTGRELPLFEYVAADGPQALNLAYPGWIVGSNIWFGVGDHIEVIDSSKVRTASGS